MQTMRQITLLICILIVFTTCRKYKYPESTYKGDPSIEENCPFLYANITSYRVNGIDSIDILAQYIDTSYIHRYASLSGVIDIRACEFSNSNGLGNHLFIVYTFLGVGGLASVDYKFSKDKKKIQFNFFNYPTFLHKNFFIDKNIWWDIIRLTKDKSPFKIKTKLNNGNIYEIQFR